jgi:pimeloyl-ACP methyl ester carboxylesterase
LAIRENHIPQVELRVQTVGQARIYYEVAGKGEPLILLHGLSGSTNWWRKNVSALSSQYRLYLVDLVGFGRSRKQHFSLQDSALILQHWLDMLGLQQFNLIGHSMGGFIAANMAALTQQRIDRLVLVDPAAGPLHRTYLQGMLGLVQALRYMPVDFLPVLFNDAFRAGPLTMISAITAIMNADMSEWLSKIQARTLIIWGEYDRLLPLEIGSRLRERLPAAQFQLIKGAGHNPMWDRPQEFNRAVLDFLKTEAP